MSVLFVALPVAMLLGGAAVVAFVLATRRGQFDDLETPRWRMLMDDEPKHPTSPPTSRAAPLAPELAKGSGVGGEGPKH